jgi:hypothetical protein
MSHADNDKPLGTSGLKGPTQDFAEFCEQERQRRIRSGEAFDQMRYDQVVKLVMDKLQALEAE